MGYLAAGDTEFRAPGPADAVSLDRRIQWVRELRREHFGAELADLLFGEDEAALRIHLERRRIALDAADDPDAARRQILALETAYPESVREARARASLPLRHAHDERVLLEAGASDAEIDALRERHFGREAADRMRALEADRAHWDGRLAAYRADRDARLAGLEDPAERAAVVAAVRAEHFRDDEQLRIEVLERQPGAQWEGARDPAPAGDSR
jgi:lipase chaperone LimK